jgi:hypothetical protein
MYTVLVLPLLQSADSLMPASSTSSMERQKKSQE